MQIFAVFSLILLASMDIGIFFSRSGGAQQSNNEYLMDGRSMSSVPVAMSVFASFVSSFAILGTLAEVYTFGFQYWMQSFTSFISVPVMTWVFPPEFYNLRLTSSYEVVRNEYLFVGTLVSILYLALNFSTKKYSIICYAECDKISRRLINESSQTIFDQVA